MVSAYLVHARNVKWYLTASDVFQPPNTAEQVRAEGRQILAQVGEPVCELARRQKKGAPIAWTLPDNQPPDCYFMIRESEPGNAHVVASRRSALILLPNTVGASGLDEVTCWF